MIMSRAEGAKTKKKQASPVNIDLLVQMGEATLNAERGAWLSAGILFSYFYVCLYFF